MNNEVYNLFLESYINYIDYLSLSHNEYSKYKILVTRNKLSENNTKVNITIRNSKYDYKNELKVYEDKAKENYYEFTSHIILEDNSANKLIEDIRNNFKENHFIVYSAVNPNKMQIIENSVMSLNIKLYTEEEIEEAIEFNSTINRDANRYVKARTRN